MVLLWICDKNSDGNIQRFCAVVEHFLQSIQVLSGFSCCSLCSPHQIGWGWATERGQSQKNWSKVTKSSMPHIIMFSNDNSGLGFLKLPVAQGPTVHQSAYRRWRVAAFLMLGSLPLFSLLVKLSLPKPTTVILPLLIHLHWILRQGDQVAAWGQPWVPPGTSISCYDQTDKAELQNNTNHYFYSINNNNNKKASNIHKKASPPSTIIS